MGKYDDGYQDAREGKDLKQKGLLEFEDEYRERERGHELGKKDRARDEYEKDQEYKRDREKDRESSDSDYGTSTGSGCSIGFLVPTLIILAVIVGAVNMFSGEKKTGGSSRNASPASIA
ncbi:MAG: hypothetical protein H6Q56_1448, partial [Deltaproteobacteria bacterium]|nr:hypothetical protein [Deltaproteobacteria bacterium]